ncbi:hypothetical protein NC653_015846 [Populus alba x Populus x berolinensis]|uniref:Uncharacterized protein n=1 Tax=Populus alba x Populus x berolinensis TaxID=444605 RepID=A0AAD6QLF0_9ROSI|nr:hypothetical protein NC653_015846 [Populus alba x Populus x berolinensis]
MEGVMCRVFFLWAEGKGEKRKNVEDERGAGGELKIRGWGLLRLSEKKKNNPKGEGGCYGEDEDGWAIQTREGGGALVFFCAGRSEKIKRCGGRRRLVYLCQWE